MHYVFPRAYLFPHKSGRVSATSLLEFSGVVKLTKMQGMSRKTLALCLATCGCLNGTSKESFWLCTHRRTPCTCQYNCCWAPQCLCWTELVSLGEVLRTSSQPSHGQLPRRTVSDLNWTFMRICSRALREIIEYDRNWLMNPVSACVSSRTMFKVRRCDHWFMHHNVWHHQVRRAILCAAYSRHSIPDYGNLGSIIQ